MPPRRNFQSFKLAVATKPQYRIAGRAIARNLTKRFKARKAQTHAYYNKIKRALRSYARNRVTSVAARRY